MGNVLNTLSSATKEDAKLYKQNYRKNAAHSSAVTRLRRLLLPGTSI